MPVRGKGPIGNKGETLSLVWNSDVLDLQLTEFTSTTLPHFPISGNHLCFEDLSARGNLCHPCTAIPTLTGKFAGAGAALAG